MLTVAGNRNKLLKLGRRIKNTTKLNHLIYECELNDEILDNINGIIY